MAKAIFGSTGTMPDMRLVTEVRRLQLRVKELEAQLADVQSQRMLEESLAITEQPEPAYS